VAIDVRVYRYDIRAEFFKELGTLWRIDVR
jgi:hypothetical protein